MNLKAEKSTYHLLEAFKNKFSFLKNVGPIFLVNDASISFYLYSNVLNEIKIEPEVISINDFLSGYQRKILQGSFWIFPIFKYRIHNINYQTAQEKPYWVHIDSNRTEIISEFFSKRLATIILNPLKQWPSMLKHYLGAEQTITWLKESDNTIKHNDYLERNLALQCLNVMGVHHLDLYSMDQDVKESGLDLELYLYKKLITKPEQVRFKHYPMHRVYKRDLDLDLEINLMERKIYGECV